MTIEDVKPGKFHGCQYDNNWHFCIANYMSSEHGDVNMKFLHPKSPSGKFFWPQCDNVYLVPIKAVYCEVDRPSIGSTRQSYCFDKKKENLESYFN